MFSPKISVVVPVYQADEFLDDCLQSLVDQSLKEIEIILVDDCSNDDSVSILRHWGNTDERIVFRQNKTRRGQAATRNVGIKEAKGEYIFFMDGDDLLYDKKALAVLLDTALRTNADEILGLPYKWYPETNLRQLDVHKYAFRKNRTRTSLKKFPLLATNVAVWSKLIRRSFLIDQNLFFDESLKRFEDNPFSWQVHALANIVSINTRPTYLYRQRLRIDRPPYEKDLSRIPYTLLGLEKMNTFFNDHPETKEVRPYIEIRYHNVLRTCSLALKAGEVEEKEVEQFLQRVKSIYSNLSIKTIRLAFPQMKNSYNALLRDEYGDALYWLLKPGRLTWWRRKRNQFINILRN